MHKYEYMNKISGLLKVIESTNLEAIEILSNKFAQNIMDDKIIHTFGTGHSNIIGIELFARAGGLGNINAILDPDVSISNGARRGSEVEHVSGLADVIYNNYKIEKGDIMIIVSNSGRNAVPIEMAQRCKKEGVYTVALTNVYQSKNSTSRHSSGERLFEIVDCVLDNCIPVGDSMMSVNNINFGPASSIACIFLLNTIISEAIKICDSKGFRPYVFQSQNIDGYDNNSIYTKYENRIKFY
ncbi:MAG: SIS domain-containing protein [Erysipelotrichaceae bacterium]|nr:SIS domain-containing protein [Erysipelotrichaceae bacterium]